MWETFMADLSKAKVLLFFGGIIWTTTVFSLDLYFVSENEFKSWTVERLIDTIVETKIKAKYANGRQQEMFEELLIRYEAKLQKIKGS